MSVKTGPDLSAGKSLTGRLIVMVRRRPGVIDTFSLLRTGAEIAKMVVIGGRNGKLEPVNGNVLPTGLLLLIRP